jgi:hypothetical protein
VSVILVIQPDAAQGRVLHDVARRIGSELVIVESTKKAVDAIARQVPDLILLSAFLSPRDEDTLMGRLRSLEGASHLQTMTIPQFQTSEAKSKKSGLFRKKQKAAVAVGADPAEFADEVVALLSRATEIRNRPAPSEPFRSVIHPEPVAAASASVLIEEAARGNVAPAPNDWLINDVSPSPGEWTWGGSAFVDAEPTAGSEPVFTGEPVAEEPVTAEEPVFFNSFLDDEPAVAEATDSIFLDDTVEEPDAARTSSTSDSTVFDFAPPKPARSIAEEIDQLVKQLGLDAKMAEFDSSPAAQPVVAAPDIVDDEFDFGASLDRARNAALVRTDEVVVAPHPDAEAIRESALAEARAVAEREAREASAAEIARVQAEAESARKAAEERAAAERQAREALAADLARAQTEAERKREVALAEARAAEARAEAERQAREALAADLAKAHSEAERKRELALAEARAAEAKAAAERQAREALAADLARAHSEAERKRELAIAEARAAEAQAAAEREARKALAADWARAQTEAEQKREAALAEARAAEARAAEERKAREALAADLARAQSEGEKKREAAVAEARAAEARAAEERKAREALAADLARAQTEAEEKRQAAIAEARAAAEREAREALAADLARVQMEAEQMRDRAIADARAAAEREGREALEAEIARVRSEAQLTFTDELNKVKQAKEEAERRRAEAERVSAHSQEAFARELTRVRAEVERSLSAQLDAARAEAEQIRAAEAEAVRERAAMEAQLKNELDRLKFITTQARKADASETKKATQQIKQLEAELASVRAKAEESKNHEVQELRAQMAEMREAAAQHARAAAAEAVAAAVAAAAPRPTAVIAQFPAREVPKVELEPVEEETPSRDRRDYLSLWSPRAASSAEAEEEEAVPDEPRESFVSTVDVRRHAKWALPIAACLLLVTNASTAISTFSSSVSKFVTTEEKPALVVQPLQEETPFIEVVEKRVGKLQLDSIPTGAEAILDGKSYGKTPVSIPDLDAGLHTLQLKGESGTVTRKVTIKANQTTLLTESIYSGWLAVFSSIPVKVVIDGTPVSLTEEGRVMVPSGSHVVEFINEQFNYRDTERLIVRPGETTPHTVTLPAGTLRVTAPEGAVIFIDGQPTAGNPREGLSVAIGSHDISARHPELGERRTAADVKQGGLTEVALRFE